MDALGTLTRTLKKRLEKAEVDNKIVDLQRSSTIYCVKILWEVLKLWGVLLTVSLKDSIYSDYVNVRQQSNYIDNQQTREK